MDNENALHNATNLVCLGSSASFSGNDGIPRTDMTLACELNIVPAPLLNIAVDISAPARQDLTKQDNKWTRRK